MVCIHRSKHEHCELSNTNLALILNKMLHVQGILVFALVMATLGLQIVLESIRQLVSKVNFSFKDIPLRTRYLFLPNGSHDDLNFS